MDFHRFSAIGLHKLNCKRVNRIIIVVMIMIMIMMIIIIIIIANIRYLIRKKTLERLPNWANFEL